MDNEEFVRAIKEALALLPASLVVPVVHLIFRHMAVLFQVFPQVRAILEPHIKAAMVLKASGLLDEGELQILLMPVLQEYLAANPMVPHGSSAG